METTIDTVRRVLLRAVVPAFAVALALSACDDVTGTDIEQPPDLGQEEQLVAGLEEAMEEVETALDLPEPEIQEVVDQLQTVEAADLNTAITNVARKLRADLAPLLAQ